MRNILLAIAIAATPAVPTLAGDAPDPRAEWPEGSAMHTAYVMADRRDAADSKLQARHSELVALVDAHRSLYMGTRLPTALEAEHEAWLEYRPSRCELFGALTGAGGAWPTAHATDCEAQLTEQRLEEVTSALACIHALPADERDLRQNECLALETSVDFGEG